MTDKTNIIKLSKHTIIYFFANVIPAIVSFFTIFFFTRLLSPSDYGVYILIYSFSVLVSLVVSNGFGLSALRYWPAILEQEDKIEFISTLFFAFILSLIISSIIIFFVFFVFYDKAHSFSILICGLGIFISRSMLELNCNMLNAEIKPITYGLMKFTKAILALSLSLILFYFGYGLLGILLGIVLGNFLTLLIFKYCNMHWQLIRTSHISFKVLKQIVSYGFPLALNTVFFYLVGNLDRWLLAEMLNVKSAGLYSAAYDLTLQCLTVFMVVINLAFYPIIVKIYVEQGEEATQSQLENQLMFLLLFMLPLCLGFLLLKRDIITVVFGANFRAVAMILIPWFILSGLFNGLKSFYFDLSFRLRQNTVVQLKITIVIVLVNVLLNIAMIPYWGITGSAIASTISYFFGLCCSCIFGRKCFSIPFPIKKLWRIIIPVLIMGMVLLTMMGLHGIFYLIIQIVTGFLVYVASLIVINWRKVEIFLESK